MLVSVLGQAREIRDQRIVVKPVGNIVEDAGELQGTQADRIIWDEKHIPYSTWFVTHLRERIGYMGGGTW
ncbi:hypothetical protein K474DRAFT_1664804 [Panus rudis PR-1116 ss-1]|nr:hypothetical protein K474DRAFT_1664804 [Panus rudis PR-1116 ss-1]